MGHVRESILPARSATVAVPQEFYGFGDGEDSSVSCSSRSIRSFIAQRLTGDRLDGKAVGARISRDSSARLSSPIRAQQFRPLQYGLRRLLLLVGRVPVLAQHSFD